ncbi:MAG TPA: hypothetical protein VME01_02435 [Solirubrobacteraceae bacterium]|nr:hypothetical protein [Solirubrobacteraceae bacterium]
MIALFAEAPALPLHSAGKYVAGAYIFCALILIIYVAIMARRLYHNQQEILELKAMLAERERVESGAGPAGPAPGETAVGEREPVA